MMYNQNKYLRKLVKCHNHLIKNTSVLSNDLMVVDGGGQVFKTLDTCLVLLHGNKHYNHPDSHISDQKIVDYCVNNVYRMSQMRDSVLQFFKVAQIFGKTSVEKYNGAKTGVRYYENQFLKTIGVSRNDLIMLIIDRHEHPHHKYIFPAYEERTKRRALNTSAGRYLCQQSTLLWAPLSPTCQKCNFTEECRAMLLKQYPELYRLRTEE